MKIGVLADIHGNAHALQAVLEDCTERNINQFYLVGDLFAKGPRPDRVFQLLKDLNITQNILGNTDFWFLGKSANERQKLLSEYGYKIFPQINQYVAGMKRHAFVRDKNLLLIHYWPYGMKGVTRLCEMGKENIDFVLSAHTHIPQGLRKDELEQKKVHFLNPGSIGIPYDLDRRSSYGILTIEEKVQFEIVRVAYEYEKEIEEAMNHKIPYLDEYITNISYGRKPDIISSYM